MKANRIQSGGRRRLFALLCAAVAVAAAAGVVVCYGTLAGIYREQCVLTDMSEQVEITSGKMVKPDVIAENLGLRVGANLAEIDFAEKREEILRKIPTLRAISITRIMPDRVRVVAEERTPVAKMGICGQRRVSGRVVDSEGVVFICQRGTQLLPTICEPLPPGTQPGHRIKNRASAALMLIETCRDPEFAALGIQDVDISKPDYLLATLGDYSRLKIVWEGMDSESSKSRRDLTVRLSNLVKSMGSSAGVGTRTWNATMPGRIFADTEEKN